MSKKGEEKIYLEKEEMKKEKISSQKAKVMKSLYKKMISSHDDTVRASQDLGLVFLKAKSGMSRKAFSEWTALNFSYMDSKEIAFCLKNYESKLKRSRIPELVSNIKEDQDKKEQIDIYKKLILIAEQMIKELQ
ncbi:MAG TPA: hypothetical protein PL048_10935 [Leptospiraceae bacterium]|nr:hypothetical protein [Leptospiraceae bacterium]